MDVWFTSSNGQTAWALPDGAVLANNVWAPHTDGVVRARLGRRPARLAPPLPFFFTLAPFPRLRPFCSSPLGHVVFQRKGHGCLDSAGRGDAAQKVSLLYAEARGLVFSWCALYFFVKCALYIYYP